MASLNIVNEPNEEESFVILGSSSPRPSILNSINGNPLNHTPQVTNEINPSSLLIDNIFNSFSRSVNINEATLTESQYQSSLTPRVENASDELSLVDMQNKMKELSDENVHLRDLLRQNNENMQQQAEALKAWNDDIMETNRLHKIKFEETKNCMTKLKAENTQLKSEIETLKALLASSENLNDKIEEETTKDPMISDFHYVNDYNAVKAESEVLRDEKNKLVVEFEAMKLQKESLENSVNSLKKELEVSQERLNKLEVEIETVKLEKISLENTVQSLKNELEASKEKLNSNNEAEKTITVLRNQLETHNTTLLQIDQLKVEFEKYKHAALEEIKGLKLQVQDMKLKLKDALEVTIRHTFNAEQQFIDKAYPQFIANAKQYDSTLKELSNILKKYSDQFCDTYEQITMFINTINSKTDNDLSFVKENSTTVISNIDAYYKNITQYNLQIKSVIDMIAKIFIDCNAILRNSYDDKNQLEILKNQSKERKDGMNELTARLINKTDELEESIKELDQLRSIVATLQKESEEKEHLKVQLEIYKSDFEAERDARTEIAKEKERLLEQLRIIQQQRTENDTRNRSTSEGVEDIEVIEREEHIGLDYYACPLCVALFTSQMELGQHVNECLDRYDQMQN